MPGFPVLHYLSDFAQLMSIESIIPSNYLILYSPLLLLPPSIRVFSNELTLCIRWPKHWSFSFSISVFREYSGLISFRIGWFDLFAVQVNLKSPSRTILLQNNSKASILQRSAFFTVQFSQPYITTGKTIALTIRTFIIKGS